MNCKRSIILIGLSLILLNLQTIMALGEVDIPPQTKSWKSFRDQSVVKQKYDYTCGAAALATILTFVYNQPTTESQIIDDLKVISHEKKYYTLADLKQSAEQRGYSALGLELDFQSLKKLKLPVITYITPSNDGHFTVFKPDSGNEIHLADPSWGNIKMSQTKFLRLWQTRGENGLILLVLPKKEF